jgi:hypothetical protein
MIFFEKNKVLGVEPNSALNILEGIYSASYEKNRSSELSGF